MLDETTPQLGEIRSVREADCTRKHIWHACVDCGKERWVKVVKGVLVHQLCGSCAQKGNRNSKWRGGTKISGKGYVEIKLHIDDFFYPMAGTDGYVLEHRLVVAKALGRNLHSWEIVHHKGAKYPKGSIENKQDNRYPENLQVVTELGHKQLTLLENRIINLEKEVKLLRWQVKELNKTEVKI